MRKSCSRRSVGTTDNVPCLKSTTACLLPSTTISFRSLYVSRKADPLRLQQALLND